MAPRARRASLSRNGLLQAVWNTFAIPGYFVVNEYGMSELSSQYYDNVIRDRYHGRGTHRAKAAPHWMRPRVLDPGDAARRRRRASRGSCVTSIWPTPAPRWPCSPRTSVVK